MISDIKKAEGSVQDIERIPAELREVYRTAWEIPQRALIDMAADRGAFIDQSQSLNLFMETPTIGKLSSMYLHAWKAGLKTTYYLRSRAATRINKATASGPKRRPAPDPGGGPGGPVDPVEHPTRSRRPTPTRRPSPAASRTPNPARHATDGTHRPDHRCGHRYRPPEGFHGLGADAPASPPLARPTNILDPGFDLTLRPMRYPQFFDMYRDAIKNTWTVDEIDFSDDLVDLDRKLMPAEKHLVSAGWSRSSPPATRSCRTTWCSTCTSTSTRPRPGCTCRASSTKRRCTSSST